MKLLFIDKKKQEKPILPESTNYLLPCSGNIEILDIYEPVIYINGDAFEVENNRGIIPVKEKSLVLEVERIRFDIRVLSKEYSKELLFEYNVLGDAFRNNLIKGKIDEEMLLMAIDDMDDDSRISLCTFDRRFDSITKKQDIDTILEYAKKIPHIFYKPKQHLKQVNEIRPAAVVSRTGQESISYLASHSEHWKGIKASGLVPERLLARVLEDDYAIYENIVVKTLVDKLSREMKQLNEENIYCVMQMQMDDGHSVSSEQKSYFRARDSLMKGMDDDSIGYNQMLLEDQRDKIKKILELFNQCKSTVLYRTLKRQKAVKGKLKKTNIFMMDKYYKYAYKLWNIMSVDQNLSVYDELKELTNEHEIFCKTLFIFALKYFNYVTDDPEAYLMEDSKFLPIGYSFLDWHMSVQDKYIEELDVNGFEIKLYVQQNIEVDVSNLDINQELIKDITEISYQDSKLIFSDVLDDNEQSKIVNIIKSGWTKNKQNRLSSELKTRLYAAFFNAKESSRKILFVPWKYRLPDNIEEVRQIINQLKSKINSDQFDECYILTISRPNEFANIEDLSVLNSLLCYGMANIRKGITKDKVGVLPMSLGDINSYRRYTKILLNQMVMLDDERKACPICGGKIRHTKDNGDICRNCAFTVIDTTCSECGEKYLFSRYDLPRVSSVDSDLPGFKVLYAENSLAFKNISEGYIEKGRVYPICPCCGH